MRKTLSGAMLAAVCCGAYASVEEASGAIARVGKSVEPLPELVELYEDRYARFSSVYPALREVYAGL